MGPNKVMFVTDFNMGKNIVTFFFSVEHKIYRYLKSTIHQYNFEIHTTFQREILIF